MDINQLADTMMPLTRKLTKKCGCGDPLDGDETFAIATVFNLVLDYNNGNITEQEYESELERLTTSGELPLFRKKGK